MGVPEGHRADEIAVMPDRNMPDPEPLERRDEAGAPPCNAREPRSDARVSRETYSENE
jgi:hypothetical protein